MLSLPFVRDNKETVLAALAKRGFKETALIDRLIELDQDRRRTQTNLDQKLGELTKLKELSYKKALEESQAKLQAMNSEYVSVRTKKEQLSELLTSNATKREDIMARIASLEENLEQIQPQLTKEKALFEELNEQLLLLTEELDLANKLLAEKSQLFNQENITYIQQLNRVSNAEQEIEFKQSAFESSKDRIEKSQEELMTSSKQIAKEYREKYSKKYSHVKQSIQKLIQNG